MLNPLLLLYTTKRALPRMLESETPRRTNSRDYVVANSSGFTQCGINKAAGSCPIYTANVIPLEKFRGRLVEGIRTKKGTVAFDIIRATMGESQLLTDNDDVADFLREFALLSNSLIKRTAIRDTHS